ncbi:antitoxin Xre/MbcA/ParS toxin-binding domain-containing protein [Polaromonas sp.]|uniref:antitoxin Xre/MbcA/ParS toxin-binding domain-containing protein n=1 Tax=Polaromonas sp. TaxID=1869339 RepID=UPI00352BAEF8
MSTPHAKVASQKRSKPMPPLADVTKSKPAGRVRSADSVKLKAADNISIWVSKGRTVTIRNADYLSLFMEDALAHVGLVKQGVAPNVIDGLAGGMNVSKDKLLATLGLRRETIRRRAKENQALSAEESSRVLGVSRLIGQVQAIVEASGNPDGFDAAAWVGTWLDRPLPALGGQRPAELMDTAEGQAVVANMILRSQSGAYA